MKKKTIIKVTIIVFIIFVVLWLPITFAINSWFFVEDPEITFAEFPIEVTYELNGEIITVKEIYVVCYSGHNPMLGYQYKGYIQSTGEEGIILYEEGNLKVICELGDADYYIGKVGRYENDIVPPHIYCQEEKKTFVFFKKREYTALNETELYDQYGIKIIDWKTTELLDDHWN